MHWNPLEVQYWHGCWPEHLILRLRHHWHLAYYQPKDLPYIRICELYIRIEGLFLFRNSVGGCLIHRCSFVMLGMI
jgi:hypothetical protein